MASIKPRKNKDGIITAYTVRVFMGRDQNGKIIWENTTFEVQPGWSAKTAQKKAEAFASTFERDIRNGLLSNDRQRFDEYCEYVLQLKQSSGAKLTTLERYRSLTARVYAAFGHIKLKDMRVEHLNKFYMGLIKHDKNNATGKPLAPRTVRHYHEFISTILQQAYIEGLITDNMARKATLPKIEQTAPKNFEPDQIAVIRKQMETQSIKWKAVIYTLLATGIRRGELLGIKWDCIDFTKNTIRIENNVLQSRANGIYVDTPKTASSIRTIGIPAETAALLKQYRIWQTEDRLQKGAYFHDEGFVFTQANGKPMSPDSISTYCRRDLSPLCGFTITPHMFRHTQASILIGNGMPVTSVAKRLGHAQVSTTMNVYAHALKNADEDNVRVLENMFSATSVN